MPSIEQVMKQGFRRWFTEAAEYVVGNIKEHWLVGPKPQRLGVITGNLRNRIYRRVLPDGFLVGTNVKYGVYWELGIRQHTVFPVKAKALIIPLASLRKGARWGARMQRSTGLTKLRGGSVRRKMTGNLAIFRLKAKIPAQKPRKFLEPGIKDSMLRVMQIGNVAMTDVLKGAFPNKTVRPK